MNILLINHYAGSPEMGMEFRPYYFAREWVKMGHKVDIIAADYSHLRRKNPDVKKDFQSEIIDGINYHWIITNEYEGNGVQRAITMFKFVWKLWKNAKWINKTFNPDIVICSSTYPLDTFAGQRIRNKSRKKIALVHELHDVWPATLIEIGNMPKYHPFILLMQIAENSAYKNSNYIISLAQYTEEHVRKHGMKGDKFKCIPLGIDINEWNQQEKLEEYHEKIIETLKDKGNFIVGYFGGHALSNALDILLKSAVICKQKQKNVKFVLVGNGVEKEKLISYAKDNSLDNVIFLPPINKNEIPELLNLFDCIYIGTLKSPLYRFGLCMNKMVDAMMSGKPILCSITSPPTWVEQCNAGIVVESEDVEGIVDGIEKIKNLSDQEKSQMGLRGQNFVNKNLNIEILSKEFLHFIS